MRKIKMIKNVSLKENQKKVLDYLISQAENEGTYTVDIINQDITDKCNFSSRTTSGNILNNLAEKNIIKKLGSSTIVLNNEYFQFEEYKDRNYVADISNRADDFLSDLFSEDSLYTDDYQNYSIAYRCIVNRYKCFTEIEMMNSEKFLKDMIEETGIDAVVNQINKSCNNTTVAELSSLLSA